MTIIASRTLRPGLLISLRTGVRGNVQYLKRDLESGPTETGGTRSKWETERVIADPAEHEAANKVRVKARTLISSICAFSAFGLLCPEASKEDLDKAMGEARKLVDEFNAKAQISRLYFNVIAGRIAPDDIEAVKAINGEVRDLLDEMEKGVQNLDASAIRDAANKARNLGQMLTPDAQARIQVAIDAARKTAREITKAGEAAAQEVDRRTIRTIREQRTAFIDLDDMGEVGAAKPQARTVDLDPADGEFIEPKKPARSAPEEIEPLDASVKAPKRTPRTSLDLE